MTNQEAAKALRDAAKSYLKWNLDAFKDDAHMIQVARADGRDLREIAKHIRAGEIRVAADKARGLDTLVRDYIPNSVWDHLHARIECGQG
jgi:hypothetical protein